MNSDETDWALAVRGDGVAAGRIFDRHRERVRRHSHRLVPQFAEADAEDVVAVVFMEAWRKREVIRFTNGSMLPWLLVTATHTAANLSRAARRYRALLIRLPPHADLPDPADGDSGNAEQALRNLSTRDQQVLTLCVLEGFSDREAAAALGVPPGTVKSRLFTAKKRLADELGTPSPFQTLIVKEAPHD